MNDLVEKDFCFGLRLEVELTEEQLNLLILSTKVYARALMNQPDMVGSFYTTPNLIASNSRQLKRNQGITVL